MSNLQALKLQTFAVEGGGRKEKYKKQKKHICRFGKRSIFIGRENKKEVRV